MKNKELSYLATRYSLDRYKWRFDGEIYLMKRGQSLREGQPLLAGGDYYEYKAMSSISSISFDEQVLTTASRIKLHKKHKLTRNLSLEGLNKCLSTSLATEESLAVDNQDDYNNGVMFYLINATQFPGSISCSDNLIEQTLYDGGKIQSVGKFTKDMDEWKIRFNKYFKECNAIFWEQRYYMSMSIRDKEE